MAKDDNTLASGKSQQELLELLQQASRAWLDRAQSEAALWSELSTKLAGVSTIPEAFQAYSECVTRQLRMSAEDSKRLLEDFQMIMQALTKSIGRVGTG
jgi:hypothetical protein